MGIAEPVRKKLHDLYSKTDRKVWVFTKAGEPEQFQALAPGVSPGRRHPNRADFELAGPLDLNTGRYGERERIDGAEQQQAGGIARLLLELLVRAVQLMIALVVIGGVLLFLIVSGGRGSRQ